MLRGDVARPAIVVVERAEHVALAGRAGDPGAQRDDRVRVGLGVDVPVGR